MTALLELDDVGYRYPHRKNERGDVLRGVSLTVAAGEAVGIVGSNGSGKSTLLKVLATLLRPTRGRVLFRGVPVARSLRAYRAGLNYCAGAPQGFYPRLTAEENLRFSSGMKGRMLSRGEIAALLDRVGLTESGDVTYARFSLGMRQRLHLAAVLFEPATVWILDEPTNGLDSDGMALLQGLLGEAGGRVARVVVSHDADFLSRVVDRTLHLRDGKVMCSSSRSS
ncbi:ABC transporter ATP-binding protein [Micromonospora sp. RTGN7]|uniref:ABC transporter ATP-binding protein n=1 Tax=Micromonospora sp. RTGN7 TaxID=3016526 RepID=UPI0029FF323F|nr:ABC transporter ATP-binding protein [Micromonospora sp. RTGN7]